MEFFENLTTKGTSSQAPTNEDSREESSSKVVEKQPEFLKKQKSPKS